MVWTFGLVGVRKISDGEDWDSGFERVRGSPGGEAGLTEMFPALPLSSEPESAILLASPRLGPAWLVISKASLSVTPISTGAMEVLLLVMSKTVNTRLRKLSPKLKTPSILKLLASPSVLWRK